MKHFATPEFWRHYGELPPSIKKLADQYYDRMKSTPRHPSVHLKQVGVYWSARVGLHYRAVAIEDNGDLLWFWIGPHNEYDKLIGQWPLVLDSL